jgi:hypothetical protein
MKSLQDKDQFEAGSGEARCSLRVLLLYEKAASAIPAKHLIDRLVEHVNLIVSFRLNLCRFDLLAVPDIRGLEPDRLLDQDIVFLAARGQEDLPPSVWSWLERWLARDPLQPRALVMSLDERARNLPVSRQIQYFLQAGASRAGVETFSHFGESHWPGQDSALVDMRYRAETTSTLLNEGLHRNGFTTFRFWGIND